MPRLSRSIAADEVAIELGSANRSNFAIPILGRTLRGRGNTCIDGQPLPGMYLVFDLNRKRIRIVEPLNYADGPKFVSGKPTPFVQSEGVYDVLTPEDFASVVQYAKDSLATGKATAIQGVFAD